MCLVMQMFYDNPSTLQVLSVSEDTHNFLGLNLGLTDSHLSRIVNAIEPIFCSDQNTQNYMHWMPRKNPLEVQSVLLGIQRAGMLHSQGWIGEALQGLSHAHVAEKLNGLRSFCHLVILRVWFPIAEAMASGCWVVGYSGGAEENFSALVVSRCHSEIGLHLFKLFSVLLLCLQINLVKQICDCSVKLSRYEVFMADLRSALLLRLHGNE